MTGCCLSLAMLLVGQNASPEALDPLQSLHHEEAKSWRIFLDEGQRVEARLASEPIYIWTNPTRSGGQKGAVYLWLHEARPVAIGSMFSHPEKGKRMICHELHSLSSQKLFPEREGAAESWQPQGPVEMLPLEGAPPAGTSAARRLVQMRSLCKEFSAHSIDYQKERWELRLLPQPMYRYERPEGDVVDGAIFAFVTSAGTDPEIVLVLEARRAGDALAWNYRAIRFSDSDLHLAHRGEDIWSSIRDDRNQLHFNADHTYRLIRDRAIDELPELASAEPSSP